MIRKISLELLAHEVLDDVDGHREDDGGVVLGRDGAEGLQISQLKYQILKR